MVIEISWKPKGHIQIYVYNTPMLRLGWALYIGVPKADALYKAHSFVQFEYSEFDV